MRERFGGFNLDDAARVPPFRKRKIALNIHYARAERQMAFSAVHIVNVEMLDAIQIPEQKRRIVDRCGLRMSDIPCKSECIALQEQVDRRPLKRQKAWR